MRIAIIGLGVISPYFRRAVERCPDTELTAVCDLDESRFGDIPDHVARFTDHHDLLAAGLADAVILTLPNSAHAEIAGNALVAGVHVCCEKPLTVLASDAERLTALAERHDVTLFTALHRRYNRNIQQVAPSLLSGPKVTAVTARYHENIEEHTGAERWYLDRDRCGGGCLIDNGPNAIDAVRSLVGDLDVVDATIGDVRAGVEFRANVDLINQDGVPVRVELDWGLANGEVKDVTLDLADGSQRVVDMLAGFPGFKSSLEHEYDGIVEDFVDTVVRHRTDDVGQQLVRLVDDAYRIARRKELRSGMSAKAPAHARFVKLLFHRRDERGMELSEWTSRCVRSGEIHELLTTTDRPQRAGDRVDAAGFLGFAEFVEATVVERGDRVKVNDRELGTVAGFDECHHPNHYNIILDAPAVVTAEDLDLRVGDALTFEEPA
ncbi:Gfo/Idh/MocA family protein [Flexivirga meconopsidis]|uniref:Gfo/Idh/MocA family protein n=1 Tax=Flexivirga meconopsidis TaxID=2977121 RepID=UPI00223FD385|nr:Gfo/Idh/MocA family oxidoreductase [Flexivirga meconopsidis]